MKRSLLPLLLLAALAGCESDASRCDSEVPIVGDGWARATGDGQTMGAAYFTARNPGSCSFTITDAGSPVATDSSLHESMMDGGMASMAPLAGTEIPPESEIRFEPQGLHVMLEGLKRPLVAGETVPLRLVLDNGQTVTIDLAIVAPGSR